ncbi:SIMPL domain-containing protein [Ferribacterium limneticum]|uniref:SIMPL domain-containing protein n=1 Tax=Ferribacterium limneticum TaxID=76259 RepID=UPI001CFAC2DD|nr:SIMPL domain-containing protein [Ferribacterium limneticum]UCV29877.1 SIMPL domain-containing protein [Ferribacterium limneticum]UCV33796.1 SIMPL domain-containing protein [Ferribacterium limneticum]
MSKLRNAWLAVCFASATAHAGTLVDLSAEASRPATNDMVRASVFSEASGNNPAELARRVNADIAEALKLIRARSGVTVKSGQQSTYPVYGQAQKIDGWRMRSELVIESKDTGAVSELLGKLQQMRLAVGAVSQMPSPETRRQVEDEATREAIRAFQSRAAVVAEQLGKGWKIKQLNIQQGGGMPMPMMRASRGAMLAAEAAPAPLEAGESLLTTNISGQIELAD